MIIDLNNNGKDDFAEIVDGLKEFVADEKALIGKHVASASAFLVGEFAGLSAKSQSFISAAIDQAAGKSGTLEETITNTLNIVFHDSLAKLAGLEDSAIAEIKSVSSSALASAIGLTQAAKAL